MIEELTIQKGILYCNYIKTIRKFNM